MEENFANYLNEPSAESRINLLEHQSKTKQFMPLSLIEDLIQLPLSSNEKIDLIKVTDSSDNLGFENFITQNVSKWDQNLASVGLWQWATRSDRLLWPRTLILSHNHHLSQRLGYTLLDLAWTGGGKRLIENFANKDGLGEMSEAFLSLLYYRSVQWNCHSKVLSELACETIVDPKNKKHQRVFPHALVYLYRFSPEAAELLPLDNSLEGIWSQFHIRNKLNNQVSPQIKIFRELIRKESVKPKELLSHWPSIWERHKLNINDLDAAISAVLSHPKSKEIFNWEFFAGFDEEILFETTKEAEDEEKFLYCLKQFEYLLDPGHHPEILDIIRSRLAKTENLNEFLIEIPKRFSSFLNYSENSNSPFDLAYKEQLKTISNEFPETSFLLKELAEHSGQANQKNHSRKSFFSTAYLQRPEKDITEKTEDDFWSLLLDAWNSPDINKLDILSQKARKSPFLFQLSYIKTLGRFEGIDNAALRLLDYVRSEQREILKELIYAFRGINTPRALQELISCITRPNFSYDLKMEITTLLKDAELGNLQAELRSAINDLKADDKNITLYWELKDTLSNLIKSDKDPLGVTSDAALYDETNTTTEDLDQALISRVAEYEELSGEARRALRTAQFFHSQVASNGQLATIDLSPAIDMQYKALELSFREKFEEVASNLIRNGILQRKLDLIGYARPIPSAMDSFERYIENLEIIKSIPFFSRFKLRKMLRAICQYRPGRRFTLDGLKAFSLFFLCFGRKKCKFGLSNIINIPDFSDDELATFCKTLHIFQDFRNRAAHEGFHPDASNNLESIWSNTADIIHEMIRLEQSIKDSVKLNEIRRSTG